MTDQPVQSPPLVFMIKRHFAVWPITCSLIILGIVGTLIEWFDESRTIFLHLTFVGIEQTAWGTIQFDSFHDTYLRNQQWWRLITPAFLHFGPIHLLFNGLALWELGRRLELHFKPLRYGLFCVVCGVVSNYVQFNMTQTANFGGLSGIVFAVVGAIAVRHWLTKDPLLSLPKGIYVLAAISLVIGFTPLLSVLFGVGVANGAHLGGLVSGVVFAGMFSAIQMVRHRKK